MRYEPGRARATPVREGRLGFPPVDVLKITEVLWRWTAVHPQWKPGEGWDAEVACVYVEEPDAVVLIDPLVPGDEAERFWRALDGDVERLALPVVVLSTSPWHERSAAELETRYGAVREAPPGVEAIPVSREEAVYWLPAYAALVAGDALLGGPDGLRLQPPEWLEGDYQAFVAAVGGLLELPVERVLPSHGEPVLHGAREALAHAHQSAATAT